MQQHSLLQPPSWHGLARLTCLALMLASPNLACWAQAAPSATHGQHEAATVTIREYIVRGNSALDPETVEQAVYPHLGPQRTMADIEAARDALQSVYHDAGYQSVFVELPEQQVQNGIVILQVAEMPIGRVRVVGSKYHSPLEIRDQVPALQEGEIPNFRLAQAQLSDINRNLDRQVFPAIKPGMVPGTMDVDLQVDDQSPWSASLGLNNDYSADTSRLRAMATLSHSNLWQKGHSASLTFFTAPERMDDAKVVSGSYSLPLSNRWNLDISGYYSDSDIATVNDTNVLGKGHSLGIAAAYRWEPLGNWHHSVSTGLEFKKFDEQIRFGGDTQAVPLRYTPVTLSYNGYRVAEQSQSVVDLSLTGASRSFFSIGSNAQEFDDKRYLANPSFLVFKGNLSHTQDIFGPWQAHGRAAFQLASGSLVSNEQFAAGGATSIRGYYAAERTGDDGYLLSLELRTPSIASWIGPWVREWRFYTFAETASLRLRDPLPEQDSHYQLSSVGLGTRLRVSDWLSAGLDWGFPLKDGPNTKKRDSRLNFSLRASF